MVLHPDVVKKAQEEIDRVVGRDRLPDFSDKERLVYVSAIVKETMRWQNVTPIGLCFFLDLPISNRLTRVPKVSRIFLLRMTSIMAILFQRVPL